MRFFPILGGDLLLIAAYSAGQKGFFHAAIGTFRIPVLVHLITMGPIGAPEILSKLPVGSNQFKISILYADITGHTFEEGLKFLLTLSYSIGRFQDPLPHFFEGLRQVSDLVR